MAPKRYEEDVEEFTPFLIVEAEKGDTCVVSLVIDGLKVKSACFKQNSPMNLKVVKKEIGVQSIDLIVDLSKKTDGEFSRYRFFVDTLPQEIIPSKTKITFHSDSIDIVFKKKKDSVGDITLFKNFIETNLEANTKL